MGAIEEIILDAVKESLNSGMVEQVIREKVSAELKDAIENSFRWGSARDAIKKQLESFLVPAIEKWNLSEFVPKLDTVLTEIVNSTSLADNKKILENFEGLMIEPDEKTITVSELFRHYKKFVAADVDTFEREVEMDDRPTYADIEVNFAVEEVEAYKYSSIEHLSLRFYVEEEDQADVLNVDVPVSRWKKNRAEGYDIDYKAGIDIQSLRYMNSFEVLLNRLKRAGVKVLIDKESDWDSVTPDAEPEATWE